VIDLVENIVKQLVDYPESVKINTFESQSSTILEVVVDKQDIGKVIGRQGRTADSIRHIVNCIAFKDKKRYILQIIDVVH